MKLRECAFDPAAYAAAMMVSVYQSFYAVISLDDADYVLRACHADAFGCVKPECADADAREIVFIVNHPSGEQWLMEEERESIAVLKKARPDARVRAYICGEDVGCFEVLLPGITEFCA